MYWVSSIIGKLIVYLSRHIGGGHGSALPGLIVEKIYPSFLSRTMAQLPMGVVLISGTNGKTTTTKILVDLLRLDGYKVFTNPSGSNYTRGVVSAALPLMKRGKLEADIAVLELDEVYATQFVDQVKPNYCLLLNVFRDQLDRFGEIDKTAELLNYVASKTKKAIVLNEDDPRLKIVTGGKGVELGWFGSQGEASTLFRNDEELHQNKKVRPKKKSTKNAVRINSLNEGVAEYAIGDKTYRVRLRLFGIHNAINCAAALSMLQLIEKDEFDAETAVAHLGVIKPAFGRGELIAVDNKQVQLILVKNPSGFRLSLESSDPSAPSMIAINDEYADGRDVSWLWDVSFSNLAKNNKVSTCGVRSNDMSIRLIYDGVNPTWSEEQLETACRRFVDQLSDDETGQIFATYTAMLKIRQILENMTKESDD